MKKFLSIVMGLVLCICFCTNSVATNVNQSSATMDNIEFIFDCNSSFSEEQKQLIVEHIMNNHSDIQTYGLTCTLFGHKYTTETLIAITHGARSTAPRCLRETLEVSTCSRCDNVESTVLNSYYINCCE